MGKSPNEGEFGGTKEKRLTKDDGSLPAGSPRLRLFRPKQLERAGIGTENFCGGIPFRILPNPIGSGRNELEQNGIDNTGPFS